MESKIPESSRFILTLRMAFAGERKADYVTVDGHSSNYIKECTEWSLKNGLIRFDEKSSCYCSDEQWTILAYRLTVKGKQILGI